jgi:dihydropteroate synthase
VGLSTNAAMPASIETPPPHPTSPPAGGERIREPASNASGRDFATFVASSPVRLRPAGLLEGPAATAALEQGRAWPLAGGPLAFADVEAIVRAQSGGAVSVYGTVGDLLRWSAGQSGDVRQQVSNALAAIIARRPPWAGLVLDRPRIMGVVNVTPDSFSDGGRFLDPARAIAHGRALLAAGADMIDIGGESTRPRAEPIAPDEEARRVEPVVRALAESGALVSIDTRHAVVMEAALASGARIINDVGALTGAGALAVAADRGAAVVLMHMAGDPRTMQVDPRYDDPALDVLDFLEARIAACEAVGISRERIAVDPGIGFGKKDAHNLALLARLALMHATGCAVMLGASRKSFISRLGSGGSGTGERIGGSLAAALWAASQGVQLVRVHDVAETRQALAIRAAIVGG